MNSYERLFRRLEGKPVDQIPNNCIIMAFGAKYIGASYREFVTDYKVLTQAAIRCREDFKLDILSVISDPMREAEGFGASVVFPEDGVPYAGEPLIQDICNISNLRVSDPSSCRRMADRVMAVEYLAQYAKKQCAVQGWIEGAFAEACDIRELNNMMYDVIENPKAVQELLEICTEQAIAFAVAQINAGADIIGVGDAAASLIGPAMYQQFCLPYEKRIIDAIHKAGAKAKLHICGNINPLLALVLETKADIIDCDWMVDFERANEVFSAKASACGNFDPVAILLHSNPKEVSVAVKKCIDVSSCNSIIAAGCEVPRDTPYANLAMVAEALAKNRPSCKGY